MIKHDAVRAAASRIGERIRRTPLVRADGPHWFKLEYLQHAGSFKSRGMFHQLMAAGELPAAGIVAASGGNAGLAAAYAARELGVPAEVFVPVTAPPVKVAKLARLGARVTQAGNEYAEAYAAAVIHAEATGARFCHAYDDPDMVAGNGTLGLELADQLPDGFDTVLVAVGPVDVPVSGVAVDSLGARRIGEIAYDTAVATGMPSVLVTDDAIVDARQRLWEDYRIAVEHGTAAAHAALISGAYQPADGERVVVLLCGANTDLSDLGAV
jgi:threonine dehydratase